MLWFSNNDTEDALLDALDNEDERAFFLTFARAELSLPQVPDPDPVSPEDAQAWQPLTRPMAGYTAVPVFTSVESMRSADIETKYATTSYAGLRDLGVSPEWLLAINPGTMIEAYLPMATIDRLLQESEATGEPSAPADEAEDLWEDLGLDPDQILNDPENRASLDVYLEALMEATVIVPTAREADFEAEVLTPEFPWRPARGKDTPTIEIFSSPQEFAAAYPGSPHVRMPFLLLMLSWPEGHALAVNPGGRVRMNWPADRIPELRGYTDVRPEVRYGEGSRIDFLLTAPERAPCYLEIKNVHLRREGRAEFPDCVTARGTRHLKELSAMRAAGARSVIFFLVQREDCTAFAPAADLDPTYARELLHAEAAGVEILCYDCSVTLERVRLRRALPVELTAEPVS